MIDDHLRLEREELFTPEVDKALARERSGRERIVADAPAVSPVRRVLLDSMVYLPLAAMLAALVPWLMLDRSILAHEKPIVRGELILVNAEPFDGRPGMVALTIGSSEVLVEPAAVVLERGVHGEPAIASIDALKVGTWVEVTGERVGTRLWGLALRPTSSTEPARAEAPSTWRLVLLFPLTGALIAFGLLLAEGLTTRNWLRMIERTLLGSFLAALFAALAFIPAAPFLVISRKVFAGELVRQGLSYITVGDLGGLSFLAVTACRSVAWACIGAGAGLGMNLARATRTQLRNSVIGGALGGALGGMFFDPIDRLTRSSLFSGASTSRLVGLLAVGLSIGMFVALVERLARDAWLRVRTGPLAGKSFILYKTPTIIGNAPASDVYLYKDAEIDPAHAAIHRVGTTYEIEDLASRMGTRVAGARIRRRRLVSGDQLIIGSTVLEFEERQKRTPQA